MSKTTNSPTPAEQEQSLLNEELMLFREISTLEHQLAKKKERLMVVRAANEGVTLGKSVNIP